jgi:hypothetical protein
MDQQQRLALDPALETPPDFASPLYDAIITASAAARAVDKEVVVEELRVVWQTENDARKARWNQQVEEDQRLAEEEEARQQEEVERERLEKKAEAEAQKKEAQKKKPQAVPILKNLRLFDSKPL